MTKPTIGVLVMSYGTPADMDQVKAYYTHIRRGKPPEDDKLKDLMDRYEAIGGVFPLRRNTDAQVAALETKLNEQQDLPITFRCYQGLKHATPFIEEGLASIKEDGIEEVIGIVLAPHYSMMSVGSYMKRAQETAQELGLSAHFISNYHLHPLLIDALSERVNEALCRFHEEVRDQVRVIFSAHSLPTMILEHNDPYPEQLLQTSKAIVEQTGISNQWQFAWQSAGQTAMPWLGPDILDVLKTIRTEESVKHTLICPIGFVSDHLEILYDLDIEAQLVAKKLDMHLERTKALNADPLYIETLADSILHKWKEQDGS